MALRPRSDRGVDRIPRTLWEAHDGDVRDEAAEVVADLFGTPEQPKGRNGRELQAAALIHEGGDDA